jgi:hypothetical protein
MLIFPQGIQGGVLWLLRLFGISAARPSHAASTSDAMPSAGETPARPHEKEGTQ